jgi:hypothetical protein
MHITQLIENQTAHFNATCFYNGIGIPVVMYKGVSYSISEFNETFSINPIKVEWDRQLYKGTNSDRTKEWMK